MSERDEYLLDLDAFAPLPGKQVRVKGKEYAVRNFGDLPADDVFLILRAEQELRGKSVIQQLEFGLRCVRILAPEMEEATLRALTARQVLRIMQEVTGAAEVPPGGADGPSGSPTNSPSSPDSTVGPGASSGV